MRGFSGRDNPRYDRLPIRAVAHLDPPISTPSEEKSTAMLGPRVSPFPIRLFIPVLLGLLAGCGESKRKPKRWNVLLVTFDTTRADHIGCYGNKDIETPNLDRLAAEGFLFERAYASAPITAPSHSTILTGLYPTGHAVRDNGIFVLDDANTTLAEMLSEAGYGTAAAVASFPLSSQFGLDQGFDLYDDHFTLPYEDFRGHRVVNKTRLFFDERPAELVNEPLFPWLDENHDEPFFVWAHYFDPHLPTEPPPPYDQLYLADLYLGEIAYADEALGQLVDRLEELGVADETIIVMTSDHGEGRGDHNEITHSTLAYNSTLHVPMIIRVPGMEGGERIETRVGTVDLVPTILDLLGREVPESLQGLSMKPLIDGEEPRSAGFPRPQYAETLSPRLYHGLGELRVLFDRDYKYIFGPRPELFDLAKDPRETNDLTAEETAVAETLQAKLEQFIQDHAVSDLGGPVAMNEATRRRLESLGYIATSDSDAAIVEKLDGSGTPPRDRVADVNEVSTAKNELFNGRGLTGLAVAETLLGRDPENVYYLQLRASALMLLEKYEEALIDLERIVELDPTALPQQDVVLRMVEVLFYDGKMDRARDLLEEQQALNPTPVGQWYLASLYDALGNREARIAALELALEKSSTFAPARVDLAVDLAKNGDLQSARRELETALRDQPYYSKGHFNFGVLAWQDGRTEEALSAFGRAAAIDSNYFQAHHALVLAAMRIGDRTRAENHLDHLRRLSADHPLTQEAARAFAAAERSGTSLETSGP